MLPYVHFLKNKIMPDDKLEVHEVLVKVACHTWIDEQLYGRTFF